MDCRVPTSKIRCPDSTHLKGSTDLTPAAAHLEAWKVAVEHAVGELMFGINLLSFSVTDEEVGARRWGGRAVERSRWGWASDPLFGLEEGEHGKYCRWIAFLILVLKA